MINKKVFKVLALSVAIILLASGCAFRGGGWMPSAVYQEPDLVYDEIDEDTMEKASFGFTAKYDEKKGETKGQFQYNDKGVGFKFHSDVTFVGTEGNMGTLEGIFYEDGEKFTFEVIGFDNGLEGVDAEDYMIITVRKDHFLGPIVYYNEGNLGGGNLKFWD